ncbi:GAP family protein [Enterococcus sp. 669A]|uniref:GAP family protein n=1 Tax=Candidatus Enterococcus moelleringii TaxID=2815325 RepID=A0ABS3LFS2_9ENTE|nr:GAP family protein [Enterococcus sp. 669A]MBO1308499.1 GAP family protein [Enterococcus sp. 669A]
MFAILSMTFVTSALDSLNPVAIAQQLSFQALSKKKKDIRSFIVGIGLTNFLAGLLFYQGINQLFVRFYQEFVQRFPMFLPTAALLAALGIIYFVFRKKENEKQEEKKVTNLNATKLFFLGVLACVLELSSALPYFAFLGLLVSYQLSFGIVAVLLAIYNVIYIAPLLLIYIFSIYFEDKLTVFYNKFNQLIHWVLRYLVPPMLVLISLALAAYGLHAWVL